MTTVPAAARNRRFRRILLAAAVACAGGSPGPAVAQASAQVPARLPYITSREAVAWEGRPFDGLVGYGAEPKQFGELTPASVSSNGSGTAPANGSRFGPNENNVIAAGSAP